MSRVSFFISCRNEKTRDFLLSLGGIEREQLREIERKYNSLRKESHQFIDTLDKSSHPEVFLRKGALKIYSKFTGEHLCRSVISIKLL